MGRPALRTLATHAPGAGKVPASRVGAFKLGGAICIPTSTYIICEFVITTRRPQSSQVNVRESAQQWWPRSCCIFYVGLNLSFDG